MFRQSTTAREVKVAPETASTWVWPAPASSTVSSPD